MEFRTLDKLGIKTSLLGFGCMRFPTTAEGKIDEVRAEQMLDEAYAAGINYYDTAWPYHNGESEPFVGKIMKKYPRESFYFATKLPCWNVKEREDATRIFHQQLEHLQSDYVDFYLLHALNRGSFNQMKDLGVIDDMVELKNQGKIKYLGFSFHDGYEAFEEILTYRDWDFCQIQYNYMDTNEQAGDKGYALCEKLNVPIVIMEPIKGGALASYAPEVEDMFKAVRPEKSIASWALRWVASKPQIKVVLSGMSTEEQVKDNLDTFGNFEALSEKEFETVENVVKEVKSRIKNGCTACRYCMPCPFGVNIPRNFAVWNNYGMYNNAGSAKWRYFHEMKEEERADKCMSCGACEDACPQKLPIREHLAQVAELMQSL
ncbi:MAG: aldo/keto reductase [Lachnospiraceae bacterium]|nr:aldo/keto reductase [Lachnospiraceae bacterium]